MNVFNVSALVKVKTTTMDLTKYVLEISLLFSLGPQGIHQGTRPQHPEGENPKVTVKMVE